jgi:nucleoid DNA-binding protein
MISDLAKVLMSRHGVSKTTADLFLTSIVESLQDGIADDGLVKVKGLGTFKLVDVDARASVDVNSGERVVIDSHKKLTFVPDNAMKELVNKPFSQFETVILNEGVDNNTLNQIPEKEQALLNKVEEALDEPEVDADDDEPETDNAIAEEPVVEKPAPVAVPVADVPEKVTADEASATDNVLVVDDDDDDPNAYEQTGISDEDYFKDEMKEEQKESSYWWAWTLLAVAACVASFAGGYLYGTSLTSIDIEEVPAVVVDTTAIQNKAAEPKDSAAAEKPGVTETKEPEAAAEAKPAEEKKAPEAKPAEEKKAPEAKPAEEKKAPEAKKEPVADWQKYDEMDNRVRLGAYGIVGTDRVVTAKEGQTVSSITRSTLGPGMECYIEVYNGLKASDKLKAGQQVKIPKVELKKKLKK